MEEESAKINYNFHKCNASGGLRKPEKLRLPNLPGTAKRDLSE